MASEATLRPPPPSRSLPLCVVWFLAMLLRRLCESVGPRRGRRHAPLPSVRRPPRAAMRPPEPSSPHPRRAVSGEGVSPMKGRPSQRAAAALQAAMPHYPLPGDTWSPRRYEAHPPERWVRSVVWTGGGRGTERRLRWVWRSRGVPPRIPLAGASAWQWGRAPRCGRVSLWGETRGRRVATRRPLPRRVERAGMVASTAQAPDCVSEPSVGTQAAVGVAPSSLSCFTVS